MNFRICRSAVLGALLGSAICAAVAGQEPSPSPEKPAQAPPVALAEPQFPKTYDSLDASRDAHQVAEAQRRQAIARQVQTIDNMVWYSAVPGHRRPLGLEALYAYPRAWRARLGPVAVYHSPHVLGHHFGLEVFGSWPLAPGRIYGYPYVDRAQQPLGHKVIVTGPNSYVYRPVYPRDLKPTPSPTPAPPQPMPNTPSPAASAPVPPPPEPIPAPPAESGPREF